MKDKLVGLVVLYSLFGFRGLAVIGYQLIRHGGLAGWLKADYPNL